MAKHKHAAEILWYRLSHPNLSPEGEEIINQVLEYLKNQEKVCIK